MSSELFKCPCAGCGVHLEFPAEMADTAIACPSCGVETLLMVLQDDVPAPERLPIGTLLSAFRGQVRGQRASLLYQLGLVLVAGAILVLPLVYLAMVTAAGYGVYWWATQFVSLLKPPHYGMYFMLLKFFAYVIPLITGATIVFFMIKPLLARRPKGAKPLALNPANEPLLFAFVSQICRTVGAPVPSRIDIDCRLNASASFRRGFRSFFGDDLVLTLGLPLVAAMSTTQLGGVIAHEFGHFSQSFALRMSYIIDTVNHWFARVIYARDQWDVMLDEWAQEEDDGWGQLIVTFAIIGVAFSRQLIKPLMWIGVGISAFISRQMEYNADAYSIEFIGSAAFEEMEKRIATADAALATAYKQMRVGWNSSRALPESFPQYMMLHDARMPETQRTAIFDRVGLATSKWYSTHPATGDRIRCARQAQKAGVFALEVAAAELFSNFEVVARQVSLLHYSDDMGIPGPLIQLRPAISFFEKPANAEIEPPNREREELEKKFGPAKLKLNTTSR